MYQLLMYILNTAAHFKHQRLLLTCVHFDVFAKST